MNSIAGRRLSRRELISMGGAGALTLALAPRAFASGGWPTGTMTIGIIADAQYADADNSPTRYYRASIAKLRAAGDEINARRPRFTIHLGDIVDRYEESFATILPVYDRIRGPRFHVLGNHDYPMSAERVYDVLGMKTPYYHLRRNGWRFVVLDTNDLASTRTRLDRPNTSSHRRCSTSSRAAARSTRRPGTAA